LQPQAIAIRPEVPRNPMRSGRGICHGIVKVYAIPAHDAPLSAPDGQLQLVRGEGVGPVLPEKKIAAFWLLPERRLG